MTLLHNAIKFCIGGHITISVNFDVRSKFLNTVVSDDGVGFEYEDVPLLFKPFTKLPDSQNLNPNGAHISLFTCKGIITSSGG